MSNASVPPNQHAELRTIAMPADANPAGDIFGGWLMGQMDLAGASHAIPLVKTRVVTVGVEAMSFHKPVRIGDRISCFCRTTGIGRSSISVHIETWVRDRQGLEYMVTEGVFTYVALDENGDKIKIVIE